MTWQPSTLEFGAFITPSAADPQRPVRLAVGAEEAGLDLATFQDHPYQPAFLDTWTLLSVVAARTSRLRLSANVLNLPLRPPVMLAQAAASLDLLTGGRTALGLGAGFFWDAITRMGVARRSPGESITALEEAVRLIRALWNAPSGRPVSFDGSHFQVVDLAFGPTPRRDIPIWLGGYKPRSLGVIGRGADGWISTLGPMQTLDDQRAANERIDMVAKDSGRDPRRIRRAINIPQSAAEPRVLADLARVAGFDTFLIMSDELSEISRFAMETVPATRRLLGV